MALIVPIVLAQIVPIVFCEIIISVDAPIAGTPIAGTSVVEKKI